jgi:DNA-binding IclR family transcriptional regulator
VPGRGSEARLVPRFRRSGYVLETLLERRGVAAVAAALEDAAGVEGSWCAGIDHFHGLQKQVAII